MPSNHGRKRGPSFFISCVKLTDGMSDTRAARALLTRQGHAFTGLVSVFTGFFCCVSVSLVAKLFAFVAVDGVLI